MKHGGMLTSHPSRYLAGHTEAGLDFRPGGFVVSGKSGRGWGGGAGTRAIFQHDGVIRAAMIVSRVF